MKEYFPCLSNRVDEEEFLFIAAMTWALWMVHNKVIFNRGNPNGEVMTQNFVRMVKEATQRKLKVGGRMVVNDSFPFKGWQLSLC